MLKHKQHEDSRDQNVKDGIRVGPYIIPKDTDYYEQIKGKDRPFVYKDIAKDTHYLYDSYSKTLTELEYPMTEEKMREQIRNNKKYDENPNLENNSGPSYTQGLYDLNFRDIIPAPSEENLKMNIVPSSSGLNLDTTIKGIIENKEDDVLFGLTLKQVIEYLF